MFFCLLLVFTSQASWAKEKNISIEVNEEEIEYDVAPIIEKGRTLVPLRVIADSLGFDVSWDQIERKAILTKNGASYSVGLGSREVLSSEGDKIILDTPTKLIKGRLLLPLRAIAELSGCNVEWDQKSRTVMIYTPRFVPSNIRGKMLAITHITDYGSKYFYKKEPYQVHPGERDFKLYYKDDRILINAPKKLPKDANMSSVFIFDNGEISIKRRGNEDKYEINFYDGMPYSMKMVDYRDLDGFHDLTPLFEKAEAQYVFKDGLLEFKRHKSYGQLPKNKYK